MNINIDRMIEKQKALNSKIYAEETIKVKTEEVVYVEKPMPTKTHLIQSKGFIYLTRYMYNKLYRVEFNIDVKAIDLIPFYDTDDGTFCKLCKRKFIELSN